MIERNEIFRIANELNLSPNTIEKDYVLGWILHGINRNKSTKDWLFKGGTSLKKCFFETFRFSEDLDFTLTQVGPLNTEVLKEAFIEIADFLYEEVGIEFAVNKFKFKLHNGNHSAQGNIHYQGPLRMKYKTASIKLDLTIDEVVVLKPEKRRVQHLYSDELADGIYANCYSFEEVVAEKIRALAQRIRPRDLYDVIHFFRNREMIQRPKLVFETLKKKCAFKNMGVPTFEDIESHEKLEELEPQWGNMLAHQLPSLPPMRAFWSDLPLFFDWLHGELKIEEPSKLESCYINGEILQPKVEFFNNHSILSKIQYAASNRLCIKLGYDGKERVVEPISFRTASNGNKLFYAYQHQVDHPKAYKLDEIESVVLTNLPYTDEKYPVEITPTGTISMPLLDRKKKSGMRLSKPILPYKLQCPVCHKVFRRKSMSNRKLNNHKDQYGNICSGKYGSSI